MPVHGGDPREDPGHNRDSFSWPGNASRVDGCLVENVIKV